MCRRIPGSEFQPRSNPGAPYIGGTSMRRISSLVVVAFLSLPLVANADVDPVAARTWTAKCAACHGKDGSPSAQGQKMKAATMSDAAWQARFDDAAIEKAITTGLKREKD